MKKVHREFAFPTVPVNYVQVCADATLNISDTFTVAVLDILTVSVLKTLKKVITLNKPVTVVGMCEECMLSFVIA